MDAEKGPKYQGFICKCSKIYFPKEKLVEHLKLRSNHILSRAKPSNPYLEDLKISICIKIRNILSIEAKIQQASANIIQTINRNTINTLQNLDKLAQIYRKMLSDQPQYINSSKVEMEIFPAFRTIESLNNALIGYFEQKTVAQNLNRLKLAKNAERKIAEIYDNHFGILACIVPSSDESFVVTGDKERYIRVWDVNTKSQIFYLKKHKGEVNTVAISSENNFLLSGSLDCTVRLWNLESRKQEYKFKGHTDCVTSVLFSKDNKIGFSGAWDGFLKVWDLVEKSLKSTLNVSYKISKICLFNQDKEIATVGFSGNISLVNYVNERIKKIQDEKKKNIMSSCFSKCEKMLIIGYHDGLMKILNIPSFKIYFEIQKHSSCIMKIELISNTDLFATCLIDGKLLIWNLIQKSLVNTIQHKNPINNFCFLKKFQKFAICSAFTEIIFHGFRDKSLIKEINKNYFHLEAISISCNLKYMAFGKIKLTLFDLENNKIITELPDLKSICMYTKFSKDSLNLCIGQFSGEIHILKIPCLTIKYSYNQDKHYIQCLALTMKNKLIGYAANDQLKIYRIENNKIVYSEKGLLIKAVDFVLNDQKLVYSDSGFTVIIVNNKFVKEAVLNFNHFICNIITFERKDFILVNDSSSKSTIYNLVSDKAVCEINNKKDLRKCCANIDDLRFKALENITHIILS